MYSNQEIDKAAGWLSKAEKIVVLTGAGVSAESGIPTFRDALEGLWAKFNPEELASREGFMANPRMVWDWYESRREKVRQCQPNQGHYALAELEKSKNLVIATQNVDQLHHRAGSQNVLELHGNILANRCFTEGNLLKDEELDWTTLPPKCRCGSYARPAVVWFGEFLPETILSRAMEASRRADLFLIAGTSGLVQPAASLPLLAKQNRAKIIEINKEESALTAIADIFLMGSFAQVMPQLTTATIKLL